MGAPNEEHQSHYSTTKFSITFGAASEYFVGNTHLQTGYSGGMGEHALDCSQSLRCCSWLLYSSRQDDKGNGK